MTSKTIPPEDENDEVARAILRSEYSGPLPVWEGLSPFAQESYRKNAHAAIAALQSRRSQPDREAIIEECLQLAEQVAAELRREQHSWNGPHNKESRDCCSWKHDGAKDVASKLRSLKHSGPTPEAKRKA